MQVVYMAIFHFVAPYVIKTDVCAGGNPVRGIFYNLVLPPERSFSNVPAWSYYY